jgi:hypothetical protein
MVGGGGVVGYNISHTHNNGYMDDDRCCYQLSAID